MSNRVISFPLSPFFISLSLSLSQKLGVLDLMDEESRFPKGTDKSLLEKLHGNHKVHYLYLYFRSAYIQTDRTHQHWWLIHST